jgi:hypothetical protein
MGDLTTDIDLGRNVFLRVCAGIENKIFYKFKIVLTLCYQYTLLA